MFCGLCWDIGVSQAGFCLIYSRSSNKLTDISAYGVSFALIGLGFCLLHFTALPIIVVSMVLIGMGMGLVTLTVVGRLSFISQAGGSGKIMGRYSTAFNLGVFASSLIIIPIAERLDSYTGTFVYGGIFAFIICAACYVSFFAKRSVSRT